MERVVPENRGPSSIPLSPGIVHGDLVFVSGQGPLDFDTGEVRGETVAEQTTLTLENIERVLTAAGTTREQVIKTQVFLTDIDDYEEMNAAYGAFFDEPFPARSALEVSDLAVEIKVEIEAIAALQTD